MRKNIKIIEGERQHRIPASNQLTKQLPDLSRFMAPTSRDNALPVRKRQDRPSSSGESSVNSSAGQKRGRVVDVDEEDDEPDVFQQQTIIIDDDSDIVVEDEDEEEAQRRRVPSVSRPEKKVKVMVGRG